ncbi:3-deoxy-D-manno-octulosonic acid transferase [Candidatus Pelagibacter sp.]|uniref:3-deoxy-D-manno-octulosonic acid transferase n=1 Tax=Candidatus Pelagibacter sp. TaxID=2024849 RepID=UPI003F832495
MFFLYQIIISILLLISPLILIIRIFKNKEDKFRFIEKFSIPSDQRTKGKLIWFHGASVGEILSIIPIIKYYEKKKDISQILVTSSTLSSSKVIEKFKFKKTIHQFYPIDHIYFTNKFLKFWRPHLAIFIESEIWPCMFKNMGKLNVPLILLNARITKKTFNKWLKIKFFSKSIFNEINIAYPQNLETGKYLKKLKTKKISLIGNLKFTESPDKYYNQISKKLKSELNKKKIWIASSTHGIEEIFCAKAHIELQKKIKNLLTIIIPRHVHRVNKIVTEINKLNLKTVLHSDKQKSLNGTDIYIVNTFGETGKFHKISNSVFLGGSIIKRGGQNPLEAARYGAKILHGPNVENFKDVYKLLKMLKISKKISTPKQLATSISFKKNKKIGIKIKNIGEKIQNKTIKELNKFINNEYKKT